MMHDMTMCLPSGWQFVEKLGEGSYGVVYRAQRIVGVVVEEAAIKHISIPKDAAELASIYDDVGGTSEDVNRYLGQLRDLVLDEYRNLSSLQGNTNIVTCQDIECYPKPDGIGYDVYIRMELLESVSKRIREGKMNREETIKLGMDICRALELLRQNGIIHRDIKPQNLFVNANGDYKLGDFGTARRITGASTMMSVKGNYAYMSPEVMLNQKVGYTSDVYMLGLVLYRLMNGNKPPFIHPEQASSVSATDAATTKRLQGIALPPPANADQELASVILKACEFKSRDRWQSAAEMHNALLDVSGTSYVPPLPLPPPDDDPDDNEKIDLDETPPKKRFWWVFLLILFIAAGSLLVHHYRDELKEIIDGVFSTPTPVVSTSPTPTTPTPVPPGVTHGDIVQPPITPTPTPTPTPSPTPTSTPVTPAPKSAKSTSSATPKPVTFTINGSCVPNSASSSCSVNLSWGKVSGATKYVVNRANGKGSETKSFVIVNGTTTGTTYSDSGVTGGWKTYRIEALNASGAVVGTAEKEIYVGKWGEWSDWKTSSRARSSTVDVESGTQYRWRSISEETAYTEWGPWSEWVGGHLTETTTREIITKTIYSYREKKTRIEYTAWGEWSDWKTACYTETDTMEVHEMKMYRFRTRDKVLGIWTSWSDWSMWSSTPVSETSSRDVEEATFYRFRTRQKQNVEYWTEWSAFSDSYVEETSTREVRTQTSYRYRTREAYPTTVYGNWSDWSFNAVQENSTRDVETRTVYRYREFGYQ